VPPKRKSRPPGTAPSAATTTVGLRRAPGGTGWELVPPRCATQRRDDLDEVHKMLEMGEIDVAIDELRYLLEECTDFVDGHRLLGELALTNGDLPLARGHFGYAYTASIRAIPEDFEGPLPYAFEANRSFFEAAKGLVHCLVELEKLEMAREVVEKMVVLDPTDPLAFGPLRDELK
jgi:hypothetical protein